MTKRSISLHSLAATGAVLALVGCGSSGNQDTTSSSNGGPKSAQTFAAAAFKYAECVRRHGVPDFPNPQIVNKPGVHAIRQAVPQSVGESPQFKMAQSACKGILPVPENGGAANAAEAHIHAQTILAFARCLRSHGVPDFPDPTAQGQLTPSTIRAAGVDLQAPAFLTAAKACIGATHGAITLAQVEAAIHHDGGQGDEAATASPEGAEGHASPAPSPDGAGGHEPATASPEGAGG